MHLIGRYIAARRFGRLGWGSPYILDCKWNRLLPRKGPEWWRSPEGFYIPVIQGGSGLIGTNQRPRMRFGMGVSSGVVGTVHLNGNYIAGTSGPASGVRFKVGSSLTLQDLYFFIDSFVGTAANVNDLDLELRTGTELLPNTAGAGLKDSRTYDPLSTVGWNKTTGWTFTLVADTVYFGIVGDADGTAGDRAVTQKNYFDLINQYTAENLDWTAMHTVNGFISATIGVGCGSMVMVFTDGSAMGSPFTGSSSSTNNALQRGLVIGGLNGTFKLLAIIMTGGSSANMNGAKVYAGATGPTGGHMAAGTTILATLGGVNQGIRFTPAPSLSSNTPYRLVFTFGGNSIVPAKVNIGTGADAGLKAAMAGGGGFYWTQEVAGAPNTWGDDVAAWPSMDILVEDIIGVSIGSPPYPLRG